MNYGKEIIQFIFILSALGTCKTHHFGFMIRSYFFKQNLIPIFRMTEMLKNTGYLGKMWQFYFGTMCTEIYLVQSRRKDILVKCRQKEMLVHCRQEDILVNVERKILCYNF